MRKLEAVVDNIRVVFFTTSLLLLMGCENTKSSDSEAPEGTTSPTSSEEIGPSSSGEPTLEEGKESSVHLEACEPVSGTPLKTWYGGIERIVYEKCMVCHGETPLYGAPFSMDSYEHMMAESWALSTELTYESMSRSIQEGSMPPPGQPMLTDLEMEELLDWVAHCAPMGDPEDAETLATQEKPQVPPPPEGLQVIHMDAGEFEVPVGQDQYMCFPFVLEMEGDKDIARIDFELDEAAVIHHMVLYADIDKVTGDEPFSCLQVAVEHSAFMFEWGPGGYPAHFPDDAGIPVKNGDKVILQVHYSNMQGLEELKDSSGLNLYLDEPRENKVSMFASGPLIYSVPPFSEVEVESTCVFDKSVSILSSTPHMHEAGREFLTEVIRVDGTVETLVQLDQWNFFEQPMYDTAVVLNPGDALRTKCNLENTGAVSLHSGDTTDDQMCFNFMYHTPPIGTLFCDTNKEVEAPLIPENGDDSCLSEALAPDPPIAFSQILGAVPPYLDGMEELPIGHWVATEASLYLPHFAEREYELVKFEESVGALGFGLLVEEDRLSFDLGMSFMIVVVSGGFAEKIYKNTTVLKPIYDETISGIEVDEIICKSSVFDEFGKVKYFRFEQQGEKLVGFMKILRNDEQEEATLGLVLEKM
jgi:hypothetical protein